MIVEDESAMYGDNFDFSYDDLRKDTNAIPNDFIVYF